MQAKGRTIDGDPRFGDDGRTHLPFSGSSGSFTVIVEKQYEIYPLTFLSARYSVVNCGHSIAQQGSNCTHLV